MTGTAQFSECGRFRYTLTREWFSTRPKLCVIGLNPSKADEVRSDPTVTRCINRASDLGFGGLLMLNEYAFIATDPYDMWAARLQGVDIIGGERNHYAALRGYIERFNVGLTIGAWGRDGGDRGFRLLREIPNIHYLALNKDGSPKHPLYLRRDLRPIKFAS